MLPPSSIPNSKQGNTERGVEQVQQLRHNAASSPLKWLQSSLTHSTHLHLGESHTGTTPPPTTHQHPALLLPFSIPSLATLSLSGARNNWLCLTTWSSSCIFWKKSKSRLSATLVTTQIIQWQSFIGNNHLQSRAELSKKQFNRNYPAGGWMGRIYIYYIKVILITLQRIHSLTSQTLTGTAHQGSYPLPAHEGMTWASVDAQATSSAVQEMQCHFCLFWKLTFCSGWPYDQFNKFKM